MNLGPQFIQHNDPEKAEAVELAQDRFDTNYGTHGTITKSGQIPERIYAASDPRFAEAGATKQFDISDSDRTYYTAPQWGDETMSGKPEEDAWKWAGYAQDSSRWPTYDLKTGASTYPTPGRAVALEVRPEGFKDLDVNDDSMGKLGAFTASSLKVTGAQWIPTMDYISRRGFDTDEVEGIQGTLPGENWNKYPKEGTSSKYGPAGDLNYSVIKKGKMDAEGSVV
jgi:hypothetical protein